MNQPPQGYPPPQHGYGPPPGYGPQMGYPQMPPKQGMSTGAKVLIALGIIGLCFMGTCVGMCALGVKGASDAVASADKKKADDDKAYSDAPAMKVSADEMLAVYGKNQIAGDQKYKDKKLEVTGKVKDIHSDISDDPTVTIGGDGFTGVMANGLPKSDAAKLNKGDTITVICKGGGVIIGSPVLNECTKK